MGAGWSSDFSYEYFIRILQAIKLNFECCVISEAPAVLWSDDNRSKLFLRHDIDVDPEIAVKMAEIENKFRTRATYMVMINSPLYSVEDSYVQSMILRLISMGHEVGLHFDFDDDEERNVNLEIHSMEPKLDLACERLENIIHQPVKSVSFHRPLPHFLRGPFIVAGRVNAYSRELMTRYLSDSAGNWREGEPLPKLLNNNIPLLQLLIHPIWWGDKHMLPEDRLEEFFKSKTEGYPPEHAKLFDTVLTNHINVCRSGISKRC